MSNHSSKGESPPSQGNIKSQVWILDESLLARLEEEKAPLDGISVQVLGLSTRTYHGLRRAYIDSICQLVNLTEDELLCIRSIGETSIDEIRHKLDSYLQRMLTSGDWDSQVIDVSLYYGNNKGSLLEDVSESQAVIVDESLLARLKEGKAPLDKIDISVLDLNTIAFNVLRRNGIDYIQQLINCTESDLLSIRQVGVTILDDIRKKLNSYIDTMLTTGSWDSQVIQVDYRTVQHVKNSLKAKDSLNQLSDLVNKLCNRFERYGLLNNIDLQPNIQKNLYKISGKETKTLGDLKRFVEGYHFGNINKEDTIICSYNYLIIPLEYMLSYKSIDDE